MQKKSLIIILVVTTLIISSISYMFFLGNKDDNEVEEYEDKLLEIKQYVREDLKKFNMVKRIKSLKGENRGVIEPKENFTIPKRIFHYQGYVTPNNLAVSRYVNDEGITDLESAYKKAVQWTWVSDSTLHNKIEWWLKPRAFIDDTPNKALYPTNPVDGMASDCESQAYTLVSIIENIGFSKENVRVVIGEVDFSGETSGHAWVQVYEDGRWYELEATSGPYWDDDSNSYVSSSGADIDYFKTKPYPVVDYYAFFNDIYFYNPDTDLKSDNLPTHWYTTEKHLTIGELKKIRVK